MAKRKSVKGVKATKTRRERMRPPRTTGEAVLFDALDAISDKTSAAYVNGCFHPDKPKMSERQKSAFFESLFAFAAVGWAFHCWSKYEDELPPKA